MTAVAVTVPDFIERDPATIEAEVMQTWIDEGGAALQPGQVEALFLKVIAYRETLVRAGVQDAALLNLLRFSRYPMVDFIGELMGVPRLAAEGSVVTLQWSLGVVFGSDVTIEAGSRAKTKDGRYFFAILTDCVIPAGSTTVTGSAQCTVVGAASNGYAIGQVDTIVDAVPAQVTAVTNTTVTSDGSDAESTERYTERLLVAPEGLSCAGSEEGYRFWALTASGAVSDVAVTSPSAGDILIAVVSTTGEPSGATLDLVEAAVSAERVRPLTDSVSVVAADPVAYEISASLTLYADADDASVLAAAIAAAQALAASRASKLHRSAPLIQISNALSVPGVYNLTLTEPVADVAASETEWLDCTAITVTIGGHTTERMGDG
jgi:phage-related baseplate assembly protein